ncbi:hypothetical protein LZQ00_08345 [Sphingobacterium sp. SRCM116780]|uniref:hypothetical protein n=1 Tax=Sphingobacterium sp. SRCM116780 TaxID=2907623 RepID=UPI001F232FE3|nr:hypothetical protein [Sphingobacterium sp. SRCM116780]UIR57817.1 hypothetical protein LZQ00_08345 [Sphingobacterium sp. SRCM116780]
MKNLRIALGVAAIALGTVTAFSFAPAKADSKLATGVFYVNPDGSMGTQVTGQSNCDEETSRICSQEYNLQTHQPTNNPALIKTGNRP